MSLQKQFWIWTGIIVAVALFLWILRGILLPFVVGMGLAYLLDPAADQLERWKFSRFWATAVVMSIVLAIFIGAVLILVPMVVNQLTGLAQLLPGYISQIQQLFNQWMPQLYEWLGEERAAQVESSVSGLLRGGISWVGVITAQVLQSGLTIINVIGLLVISPVVAFYLLLDWDRMTVAIDNLLPRAHREEIRGVMRDIDRSMAAVIRGQGSVILILAAFYAVALSVVQLNFGLAIGIAAGLLSFIPYVGFLVGFVLSVGVALVQFWPDGVWVAVVAGIFLIGQFLEGNLLYPKLVGSSIGVHPVWLMFSLFAVGILLGPVGVLLAVPVVAVVGVFIRFAIRKYREGPLYLGTGSNDEQAAVESASSAE